MKDEKKHYGTVDESSLEQQFHKSDAITFESGAILLGFTAGSLAARHSAKILVDLEVFKILYGSNR